jgi:hypothetical protein
MALPFGLRRQPPDLAQRAPLYVQRKPIFRRWLRTFPSPLAASTLALNELPNPARTRPRARHSPLRTMQTSRARSQTSTQG